MVVKEGYKNTEVGVIPVDWEVDKIENVCSITTGSKNTQDRIDGAKYPFFVRSQTIERIDTFSFDGEAVLTAGDGVGTGKIFHYINDKFDFHQRVYKMSHFKENMNGYFFYLYFSNHFYDRIMQMTAKSSVDSVRREMIANMKILIPTLPEQTAIATVLSDTDNLIQALEKKIAKKELIKKGAMQELLEPKEGWERIKIDDAIDVYRGGSPRPIQDYITPLPFGVNWIKIGDTSSDGKYITHTKERIIPEGALYSRSVSKGDFLLSNSMSFGRPYILKIDGCIHDGWLVLQNYQATFDREFLYYTLISEDVLNQYLTKASGSGVLNLNKELVKTVELNRPKDVAEQTRIAQILSDMDTEIESLQDKLSKYKQLKQGLMQELLTGRIRLV